MPDGLGSALGHTRDRVRLSPMALIHTCYRITDIDRSVAFYEALGFQEVGRIPIKDEAVNVFMNQPGDGDMPRLELTYKDRKSTRLNSSHVRISYAVFCLKKKN